MKTKLIVMSVITALALSACGEITKDDLKGQKEKISYGYGLSMGRNLKQQEVEIDYDIFMKGLKDGIGSDTVMLLTDAELQEAFQSYMTELNQKKMDKAKADAAENKKKGQEFLSGNKNKEGVVELASGVQYKVIKEGSGTPPKPADVITFHYTGKTLDGKVFDSTSGGAPAESPLSNLIPGWREVLTLMKPGAKCEIYIPSDLAYGDRGAGDVIPPGATLIFEVELVSVKNDK